MKNHKLYQASIILFLVAIAFFIKGWKDNELVLFAVGAFVLFIAVLRMKLIHTFQKQDIDYGEDEDIILKYLNKDPILYVEMIESYKRNNFKILYHEIDGLLLCDQGYGHPIYFASAMNEQAARDIIRLIPTDFDTLVAHECVFEKAVEQDLKVAHQIYTYNHVYESRKKYVVDNQGIEFRMLDESYLEIIKTHYTIESIATDEYIGACIKRGMLGAFIGAELVGFIGQHDTGALGLLEVFEAYRGKNIATLLQQNLVNYLIEQESVSAIFSQVNVDNAISLHLQEKLNFKRSKTPIIWYFS